MCQGFRAPLSIAGLSQKLQWLLKYQYNLLKELRLIIHSRNTYYEIVVVIVQLRYRCRRQR
ncbi:hypothetical protein C0J52_14210 [Blattella germanica]|nr:hypothetical protein C0J52_14210 [Blattella germanica]